MKPPRFNLASARLNAAQLEAVKTVHGPLLILAGAGTGKTRVITYRIAYLLTQGIKPENVLAVTFTNKAAREMRARVASLVAEETAQRLTVCTFHSFCARLLRRHIQKLGYSPRFEIASTSYQFGLIRQLMAEFGWVGEGHDPTAVQARISLAKNALETPDDLLATARLPKEKEAAQIYELYVTRMRNMDLLDFDDLLMLVNQLWDRFPDLLEQHRELYQYILVDEYQDTNVVQFRIVAALAGKRANLCVVGDDDQSIYGWRGATLDNILRFEEHFPRTKVIRLEQNYRSTTTILDAANAVIAQNPKRHEKSLHSDLGRGELLLAVRVPTEDDEARTVGHLLHEWTIAHRFALTDVAILYRSNHQSRLFEERLREVNIAYTLVGSRSFYERKEVLDAISLLQAVWNPRDDMALLRILNVPPRGLGDKSIERLRELQRTTQIPLQEILLDLHFQKELSAAAVQNVRQFAECLDRYRREFSQAGGLAAKISGLFRDSGYLDGLGRMYKPREDALERQANLHEFANAAGEYENRQFETPTLGDFLERFALMDDNDRDEQAGKDGVTLMTVHAAKGLEFPAVIIVGMEQGLFPHQNSVEENRLDEERRLFYVALTRAQKMLVLLHADQRKVRGALQRRRASPFLAEIPEPLIEWKTPENLFQPATADQAMDNIRSLKALFADDE